MTLVKAITVRDVALIARDRRSSLGWSQAQLAAKVGVGREWIIQFEKGKPTAEWGLVLRVLRELGIAIDLQVLHEAPDDSANDLDRILNAATKRKGEA